MRSQRIIEDRERYILYALLFLIGFVYLVSFDLKGIWTDEGLRLQLMNGNRQWQRQMMSPEFAPPSEVLQAVAPYAYQPFYYLLGNALFRLGNTDSDILIRGINILFLFLSLAGLHRFARDWDWRVRIFLILTYALNGYMMLHVMQVREYPLYQAILIWSSAIFFDLLETPFDAPSRRFWRLLGLYVFLVVLGYYTHIYLLFTFPLHALFAFFRAEQRRRFLFTLTGAYFTAGLAALPWLAYAYRMNPNRHDSVLLDHRPQTFDLLVTLVTSGFWQIFAYWDQHKISWLESYAVLAGLVVFATVVYAFRSWRSLDIRFLFGVASLTSFLGFQITYFFLRQPMSLWTRYFIGNYFGVTVCLALAFHWLLQRSDSSRDSSLFWRVAPALAVVLSTAAGFGQISRFRESPFVDTILSKDCQWDQPSRAIMGFARPEDTVVFYHPMQAWTMSRFYQGLARESNYDEVLYGQFLPTRTVWMLDTNVELERVPTVIARLESMGYRKSLARQFGCGVKLLKFEFSDWKPGTVPDREVPLPPVSAQRIKDLRALESALAAYFKDHNAYPASSGGYDGYFSNYGQSKPDWIPGLAPKYIKALPRDPRRLEKSDPQYYYWSDGKDFKLFVHAPEDCALVKQHLPTLIDASRNCWAYGIWSPGGASR
jgi:hypothetical protein